MDDPAIKQIYGDLRRVSDKIRDERVGGVLDCPINLVILHNTTFYQISGYGNSMPDILVIYTMRRLYKKRFII